MSDKDLARYGALTGVVFAILLIVGFVIVTPNPPDANAAANEWAQYYSTEKDGVRAAAAVIMVGLFFYVWFLGSLSSALRKIADDPRLPAVALAGGVLGAVFMFTALTITATAAYRPDETSPEVIRVLNDLVLMAGAPAFAGFTALLGATALVILRSGKLPRWLGILCAAGALTQPLTLAVIFTESGVFAPDGAFGLILPFAGLVFPIAALSLVLAEELGGGGGDFIGRVRAVLGI